MECKRKNVSLAKQLTRSLKLSRQLSVAHTKAILKAQQINVKRAGSGDQTQRTTD
jgi:hypothetical protein